MYQNDAQKVLTGEVRLSYCNLVNPRAPQNGQGDPKYSVTILIPKTDTATVADIQSAYAAATEAGVASLWNGSRPQFPSIIWDGDGCRQNGEPFGAECKGHWVLTASSKQKPQVVHISNVNTELAPQDIYSGMYARVTLRFYPYNTAGRRAVGCGLNNVCKTRDGEPLSGRTTAASDFAGIAQPAAASAAAPATPGATGFYGAPDATGMPGAATMAVNPLTGMPGAAAMAVNPLTGMPY